jgi:hypothetical protein
MRRGVRHVALAAAAATALAAGTACGSSSSPKAKGGGSTSTSTPVTAPIITTTTLPLAQRKPQVQAFFAGPGKPLITFEKGVEPLFNGKAPDPAHCRDVLKALMKRVPSSDTMNQLVSAIPSPDMIDLFQIVFRAQSLVLGTCWANTRPPQPAITNAQQQALRMKPSFAYYGIPY